MAVPKKELDKELAKHERQKERSPKKPKGRRLQERFKAVLVCDVKFLLRN